MPYGSCQRPDPAWHPWRNRLENAQPPLEFNWRRPQTFFQVAVAATLSPKGFFEQMPRAGSLSAPMLFVLAARFLPALAGAVITLGEGPGKAIYFLVYSMISSLVLALALSALLYAVVQFLFRQSSLTFDLAIRVVCYSWGVQILSLLNIIPSFLTTVLLTMLIFFLILYVISVGLRVVGGLTSGQTWGALGLALLILGVIWIGLTKGIGVTTPTAPPSPVQPGS